MALHESKMKRARTIISESTTETAAKVLQDPDVVDIVCGPLQTKLRQLQKQLAEEKALHRQTQRCVYIIGLLYALVHALIIMIWLSSRELRKELRKRDSQLKEGKQKLMQCESEVKRLELKSAEEFETALEDYKIRRREQEAVHQDELIKAQGLSGAKLVSDQYHAGICGWEGGEGG